MRKSKNIFDQWTEGYLSYQLEVRKISPRTIIDMRCTLNRLFEYIEKEYPGVAPWKLTFENFLQWIEHERECGKRSSSISKDISHIRGLLDYSWRGGRAVRNVLDGFSLSDAKERLRPPRALDMNEARALVNACRSNTKSQRKERMMILMLYGCGLRTDELCNLCIQNVDVDRKEIFVCGKGDKERIIPVPEGVWSDLLAYMYEVGRKQGPLFRTEIKRKKVRSIDVCNVVNDTVIRAGITGEVTPRTLRHTFATHLMNQGVDVGVIASLMGHRSPRETGVYLHSLPGKQEGAVDKLNISKKEQQ